MKKELMCLAILINSLFIVSCSGNLNSTGMHLISVYDTVSRQMTEYPFEEYIAAHGLNMLVPLDATCSVCLFETTWWEGVIRAHGKLKPVFVVNTSDLQYFIWFYQASRINKYPVILDNFKEICKNNRLRNNVTLIFDKNRRVLYRGDSISGDFSQQYETFFKNLN